MSQTITAIYEHGVLRPMQPLPLREAELVSVRVVPLGSWQERFDRVLDRVHRAATSLDPAEIEEDVRAAIREARADRRAR